MTKTMKFVLPLLAATILAGCGKDAADTAVEKLAKQQGVDVDIKRDGDNATFTMGGADGSKVQVGENLKMPDGFPGDIAVYPGMKISTASSSQQGFLVHAQTGDSLDKVASFYTEKMASDGWEKESELTQPEMRVLTYKKEGRHAAVNIFSSDGTTTLQLTTSQGG